MSYDWSGFKENIVWYFCFSNGFLFIEILNHLGMLEGFFFEKVEISIKKKLFDPFNL